MKNLKKYLIIIALTLTSHSALLADGKKISICTNAGNVFLPSSETSKMNDKDNGTLICWLEESNNGSLWIQKMDIDGRMEWAANGVLTDTDLGTGFTADSDYPLVFSDNKGGAVIIYRKIFSEREDIYFQKVSNEGELVRIPVLISSFYGGYNYSPSAALTSDNFIAVTWENFSNGDFDIHAQLLDMDGNKVWNNGEEIKVCDVGFDQRKPTIACNEYNDIVIAWLDARNRTEYSFDLYANILNIKGEAIDYRSKGKLVFKNIGQVTPRKDVFYNHNMAPTDKNSFIIALENSFDNLYSNINIIKVNNDLNKEWTLDLHSGSHQAKPLIAKGDNYNAGIIWNDLNSGINEIKGVLIDQDGVIKWGSGKNNTLSCGLNKPEYEKEIPSERNQNAFLINNNKIYANWVTTNINKLFLTSIDLADESVQCDKTLEIQDNISEGEYTSITTQRNSIVIVYKQSNGIFAAVRNLSEKGLTQENMKPELRSFPNPFNPSTKISFGIPSDGFVKLSVFDITGRLIKTLVNEFKTAGNYNVTFDGSNLPSGVYFTRLEANGAAHTNRITMLK